MRKCIACSLEKEDVEFKSKNKCKQCYYLYNKEWIKNNRDRYCKIQNKHARNLKTRWRKAKRDSSKRFIIWLLSFKDFELLSNYNCYYCNGVFPKTEVGSGLDRLNPKIGYTKDNVVQCCWTCNKIKSDVLSSEEAKSLISILIKMRGILI